MNLIELLRKRSEWAYVDYISLCRRNECLGAEAKMSKGIFRKQELDAHTKAAELLGRHRAYADLAKELSDKSQVPLPCPTSTPSCEDSKPLKPVSPT
jgi:hypothetical protein